MSEIRIQNVHDKILEKNVPELVIKKDNKTFIGPLFFEMEDWEKPNKIIEKVKTDGTIIEQLIEAYYLFQTKEKKCLVKCFKCDKLPDYPNFGSMGDH